MNNSKQMRMENPLRIAELNPLETLIRIGLGENDTVCDIGAGSGIFTIPAAQITKNKVYALEIDDEMLEVIGEKMKNLSLSNIELVKVNGDKFPIEDQTVDFTLMVTVFHEIEN
ncbi:MAG TPA: methyltransferase domain-containing protein, partial [Anaerovoracaceae bacterium]|nr:methyltransferase domain-containing protein [Anaerovoracaceae bacterium]